MWSAARRRGIAAVARKLAVMCWHPPPRRATTNGDAPALVANKLRTRAAGWSTDPQGNKRGDAYAYNLSCATGKSCSSAMPSKPADGLSASDNGAAIDPAREPERVATLKAPRPSFILDAGTSPRGRRCPHRHSRSHRKRLSVPSMRNLCPLKTPFKAGGIAAAGFPRILRAPKAVPQPLRWQSSSGTTRRLSNICRQDQGDACGVRDSTCL